MSWDLSRFFARKGFFQPLCLARLICVVINGKLISGKSIDQAEMPLIIPGDNRPWEQRKLMIQWQSKRIFVTSLRRRLKFSFFVVATWYLLRWHYVGCWQYFRSRIDLYSRDASHGAERLEVARVCFVMSQEITEIALWNLAENLLLCLRVFFCNSSN